MHSRILAKLKSEVTELEGTCRIRINLENIDTHSLSVKDHNTVVDALDFVKRAEKRAQRVLVIKMLEFDIFESEVIIADVENFIRRHTEYKAPAGWDSVTT